MFINALPRSLIDWRAPNSLKDPNVSPKIEYNIKARSRGTLPGSQHLKGVEGRAGASGWD
jgi:hypothetical protein